MRLSLLQEPAPAPSVTQRTCSARPLTHGARGKQSEHSQSERRNRQPEPRLPNPMRMWRLPARPGDRRWLKQRDSRLRKPPVREADETERPELLVGEETQQTRKRCRCELNNAHSRSHARRGRVVSRQAEKQLSV